MKFSSKWVCGMAFVLCTLFSTGVQAESFKHNIQLQLSDAFGVPVTGTEFWVTLNVVKEGSKVTIQLPLINFITGPYANAFYEPPPPPLLPGGYLTTADGFLPFELRPNDIVYRSWLSPSNNGQSLPFSFSQPVDTLPVPPAGYIVSITNAGALNVQCSGTFANIIPPGPQILLPTDISYVIEPQLKLKYNTTLSNGATNTTQFTGAAANDAVRDTHFNDANDGVAAWTWTDNSMIADKTNNTVNAMVAIGKTDKNGKLKVRAPVQLSDLAPGVMAWDTAVAINRTDKKNIVVSYGVLDHNLDVSVIYRAVSFDGGKTWPENGPVNIQPTGTPQSFGDYRGVASDKYGNIWLCATNLYDGSGNFINQPFFAVSTDGGVTFQLIYTFPPPVNAIFDYPQYCFGGDGLGGYGLQYSADFGNFITGDLGPVVGFIPINGPGSFGTPSSLNYLTAFNNIDVLNCITASADGRVWYLGVNAPLYGTGIDTILTIFKSPGPVNQNFAGPWDFAYANQLNVIFGAPIQDSQPVYLVNSVQSNLYDDNRQALYSMVAANYPDFSQDMRIYFSISRDNAQTWSGEIDISNTFFANRGFQSMALDTIRGDLYFGWYDGRNDPTFQAIEYLGAVMPAKLLNKLVKKIPASNPLYTLPASGEPLSASFSASQRSPKINQKKAEDFKKRIQNKFGGRLLKTKA